MQERYALEYRSLYERHWWWRAREAIILDALEDWKRSGGAGSILDVGCGDGLLFGKLASFGTVEGIETDPASVAADGPWRSQIRVGPFDDTFEPLKRYALILMLDVLEHFADPVAALTRARELLEPHGVLLLTVPAFPSLWTSHDDLNHHYRRYTRTRLRAEAESAGLSFVTLRYFFRGVMPLKLAVRVKETLFGASADTPAIPPDGLNRLLYRLALAEEKLLRALPLPFGASLLGLARDEAAR